MLENWENDYPDALNGLMDVKTGMKSVNACIALYEQGLELVLEEKSTELLASPVPTKYEYAHTIHFAGMHRTIGARSESKVDVVLHLGMPSARHTVEHIDIRYFFADQDTPEPDMDQLRDDVIDRFGTPSVEVQTDANVFMYWLIAEGSLSALGFEETCGFSASPDDSLWWKINDTDNADPTKCSGILHVSFGGNHGDDAPNTSRYLNLKLYDTVRMMRNKLHEDAIREAH
ncbi:hypothetical protein KIN_22430 [Litoreibacter roseus]|uniref:Uncharacterized protein n=2 Tax=Litoreibacter roseus TaxID=2601869 RepID=A0A6N6JID6_9RHOB|nr:hypothetical protein KIN_22430 [Litoreibacter roseus]